MKFKLLVSSVLLLSAGVYAQQTKVIPVKAANFSPGANMSAKGKMSAQLQFVLEQSPVPFNQSAVKQNTQPASLGPNPKIPYFNVRFAIPIPPAYTHKDVAAFTGIDSM